MVVDGRGARPLSLRGRLSLARAGVRVRPFWQTELPTCLQSGAASEGGVSRWGFQAEWAEMQGGGATAFKVDLETPSFFETASSG